MVDPAMTEGAGAQAPVALPKTRSGLPPGAPPYAPSYAPPDEPSYAPPYAPSYAPPDALSVGARSDVGCVRAHNEDAFLAAEALFVVADGMGGHAAGEVASALAINAMQAWAPSLAEDSPAASDACPDRLVEAVLSANDAIIDAVNSKQGAYGMGTTLTAAVVVGERLLLAHVGDSRAYLLTAEGSLRQLTRDHSFVEELVALGRITRAEAAVHPKRSIITRALGSEYDLDVDLYEERLLPGDRLLLCTDGLTGMVEDAEIRQILLTEAESQNAADALVDAACTAGGMDNVTVIVIDSLADAGATTRHALAGPDASARQALAGAGVTAPHALACPGAGAAQAFAGTAGAPSPYGAAAATSGRPRRPSLAAPPRKDRRTRRQGAPRRIPFGLVTFVIVFILLVASAAGALLLYANHAAFLRTQDGYVNVYRGLSNDLPFGLRLEWFEYRSEIQADALDAPLPQRLRDGVQVESMEVADALIEEYSLRIQASSGVAGGGGS
jgi:serine/threonine protein phosphatase PrpC